jgi:hypothetical protein
MGSSELMALYGKFIWHYHDLCLFHQAIYAQIVERKSALEALISDNRAFLTGSVQDEWEAVPQSRLRDTVHVHDQETLSMENFADQLILIGLWAMIEQYC